MCITFVIRRTSSYLKDCPPDPNWQEVEKPDGPNLSLWKSCFATLLRGVGIDTGLTEQHGRREFLSPSVYLSLSEPDRGVCKLSDTG